MFSQKPQSHPSDIPGNKFVIAFGNAFDGIKLHGPFKSHQAALDYANDNDDGSPFWIVQVSQPVYYCPACDEVVELDRKGECPVCYTFWPQRSCELLH